MRLLPYGPRAVLAEFEDLDRVMAAAERWRRAGLPGVTDVVPAERTVLVVHDGSLDVACLEAADDGTSPGVRDDAVVPDGTVEVPVVYDGADLESVARDVGGSVDDVIALHTRSVLRVAFCGFMPGFAYLVGLPTPLHLPRRSTPRARVPAGSVAIAAGYGGVYPRESPGGWHLLGRTDVVLWDDRRDVPALLAPGTTVRFVAR